MQESIAKLKEVWKETLKSHNLSKKFPIAQTNAIEDNERFKDDLFLWLRNSRIRTKKFDLDAGLRYYQIRTKR